MIFLTAITAEYFHHIYTYRKAARDGDVENWWLFAAAFIAAAFCNPECSAIIYCISHTVNALAWYISQSLMLHTIAFLFFSFFFERPWKSTHLEIECLCERRMHATRYGVAKVPVDLSGENKLSTVQFDSNVRNESRLSVCLCEACLRLWISLRIKKWFNENSHLMQHVQSRLLLLNVKCFATVHAI